MRTSFIAMVLPLLAVADIGSAADACAPAGEPQLDPPTMHSLGAYWLVQGDDDRDTRIDLAYRVAKSEAWTEGAPLWRVPKAVLKRPTTPPAPEGGWLFAGSAVLLEPGTAYELRLTLNDPDGGQEVRTLTATTAREPDAPADAVVRHVVPGSGGGSGSEVDPFKGLAAAAAVAKAGDLFLVHAGSYPGEFTVAASGESGKPIVWRGAGDGEAIIDRGGTVWHGTGSGYGGEIDKKDVSVALTAVGVHDVWFEGLTIRNATYGLVAHRSARIVVRRCWFHDLNYALTATQGGATVTGFFIADNRFDGPATGPMPKGPWDSKGVQLTGIGHEICRNRLHHFADDTIATEPGARCANDIYLNDIGESTEGIEVDESERNTRCFMNRITNVFHGVSAQPVHGGPVYAFRNAMYNVSGEAFKLRNPSGFFMIHNTQARKGAAFALWTPSPVNSCFSRCNLFVGSGGPVGYDNDAAMTDCDFDYDGFAGGSWPIFMKWNKKRYPAPAADAPAYQHAVVLPGDVLVAAPPTDEATSYPHDLDLRLRDGSRAIDAGVRVPGFDQGTRGAAPDLGAFEHGSDPPRYGPRG